MFGAAGFIGSVTGGNLEEDQVATVAPSAIQIKLNLDSGPGRLRKIDFLGG